MNRGYTLAQLANDKGFPEELLRSHGVRDGTFNGTPCVEIPCHNCDGTLHPRFQIRTAAAKRWFWNTGSGTPVTIHGAHHPVPIGEDGSLLVVEGPSDCWACWSAKIAAIGIAGATSTKHLTAEHVRGATVLHVVMEPGEAGSAFPARVAAKAWANGFAGDVFAVTMPDDCKDPRALLQQLGGDVAAFKEKLQEAIGNAVPIERPAAPQPAPEEPEEKEPSQCDFLISLIDACEVKLFNDAEQLGEAYARIPLDGMDGPVKAFHPVRSRHMKQFLTNEYYRLRKRGPRRASMDEALDTIEARANSDEGTRTKIYLRFAHIGNPVHTVCVDLGTEEWTQVTITKDGWSEPHPHTMPFRRSLGFGALPTPVRGGKLDSLRKHVHLLGDENNGPWALYAAFLIHAIGTPGPYGTLSLVAEAGGGKTHFSRVTRALIDPSEYPTIPAPRSDLNDLFVSARETRIVIIDNLSYIDQRLSDLLCVFNTGGAHKARTLYSNLDVTAFKVKIPLVLTMIGDAVRSGDLVSRCVTLPLRAIPEDERKDEGLLWADFEAESRSIFGALLDAVVVLLREWVQTRDNMPGKFRLAEYSVAAKATEHLNGVPTGTWEAAFRGMQGHAHGMLLEGPFAQAVLTLMKQQGTWIGTASALLAVLELIAGINPEAPRKPDGWPSDPTRLSTALRRLAPSLRDADVEAVIDPKVKDPATRRQLFEIRRAARVGDTTEGCEGTLTNGVRRTCEGSETSETSQPSNLDRAMDSSRSLAGSLAEDQPSLDFGSLQNGEAARGHEDDEINRLFNDLVL